MKQILTLLVAAVTVTVCKAQTVTFIEPRNVQTYPDAGFSTYTVKDHFYVLHKKFRLMAPIMYDMQLDVYDAARKPVGSAIIDATLAPGDANIPEGVFAMKEQLVMFKSEYKKVDGVKTSLIYCYPFETNGKRKPATLLTSFEASGAFNAGNFNVNVSADGGRVAVMSELPYDKDGMEKTIVTVYDENFKQLWKKEYEFPYESVKAPKNEIFVNNEGTVFLLKRIKIKKAFDQFSFFTFGSQGKSVTESKVSLGESFTIATSKDLFTAKGDLVMGGYFYNDKKVGINVERPDGNFLLQVNAADGKIAFAKTNTEQSMDVKALQLIPAPGGGYWLVGEHQFIKEVPIPGKNFEYSNSYLTGNISVCRLAADGAQLWNYRVNKQLESAGDGARLLSAYAVPKGEQLSLIFADYLHKYDDKKQIVVLPGLAMQWVNIIETIGADGKKVSATWINDIRMAGKKAEYLLVPATGDVKPGQPLFMLAARGRELVGVQVSW
jgi:hypothetical protein